MQGLNTREASNARHHPRPHATYMRDSVMGVGCMPLLCGGESSERPASPPPASDIRADKRERQVYGEDQRGDGDDAHEHHRWRVINFAGVLGDVTPPGVYHRADEDGRPEACDGE